MITRLAGFAIRRPVLVLVSWALAVAVLAAVGRGVDQKLMNTIVPPLELSSASTGPAG